MSANHIAGRRLMNLLIGPSAVGQVGTRPRSIERVNMRVNIDEVEATSPHCQMA